MTNDEFQNLVIQNFQKVFAKIDFLEKGQQYISKDLTRLETRIENEVVDKVRSLYDARELHQDQIDQVNEKLSDMDDKLDYLLLKTAKHEAKLMAQKKMPG